MPGGYFRDNQSGEMRYFNINDYEERRRDDLDRRIGSLRPRLPPLPTLVSVGPTLFHPYTGERLDPLTGQPQRPRPVSASDWVQDPPFQPTPELIAAIAAFQRTGAKGRPLPILQQPNEIDWSSDIWHQVPDEGAVWLPELALWAGGPTPASAIAVDLSELQQTVNRVPEAPARIGQFPEIDASFDQLVAAGRSIEYRQVADLPALAPRIHNFKL